MDLVWRCSTALSLPYTPEQLVRVAHRAEVTCRTGLGDVSPQAMGGLVFSLEPGAPPHGKWMLLKVPEDLRVICCTLGPLKTKRLLRDQSFLRRCERLGKAAVNRLKTSPDLTTFIKTSREFASSLGVFDRELLEIADSLERAGALGASQVMLGRSVFAFVSKKKVPSVKKILVDLVGKENVFVCGVASRGPRVA